MKVLHVLRDARPFGGKQRYVKQVAQLWQQGGGQVTLLSMDPSIRTWGCPARVLPRLAVDATSRWQRIRAGLKRLYNPDVRRLASWLRLEGFDIVHLHDHIHFSIALLDAIEMADVPCVYTLHDHQLICPVSVLFREREGIVCEACRGGRYWNAVRYRCSHGRLANSALSALDTWLFGMVHVQRRCALFIAPSQALVEQFVRFGWPRRRFFTLPHFIEASPSLLLPPAEPAVIVCVARLWRQKGVHLLLQAASRLRRSNLTVVIAGDGPQRHCLQQQAGRLGLDAQFLGAVDPSAVATVYARGVLSSVPSVWPEVFGLVVLESFAVGRPVVASAIGGLPEVVRQGTDGWLIPPGDVEALADRIDWLLGHPKAARDMGMAGYARVIAEYNPEQHYCGLRLAYERAMAEYRPR
ncbi:glycosyltransferase family 4 protein [Candidatus Roseilinea sp. NK_OTU-006]|jgi:glycosyltransferase involved in cell wall biosynthesis|uniref:glycosyltransferase family 4 protein n=1 Tax=Candidatus Roseilinea sp. NK_OTU-006 TaxID=2704250 RepID=UPI00145C771A|nr:glycosyltransferase family 4 protein [Candidatus Roseilinea sp. NK_OTU-006]